MHEAAGWAQVRSVWGHWEKEARNAREMSVVATRMVVFPSLKGV